MQIQYCDGCNLRVDNKEIVSHGEKIYCPSCAEKFVRPGSGMQPGARPVSGMRRVSPAPGNQRRTPSGGNAIPASSARNNRAGATQVRSAGSTTITRSTQAPAQASNNTLVWGLAGAGVLLAAIGIFLMSRGKPAPASGDTKSGGATVAQGKTDTPKTGTATNTGVVTPTKQGDNTTQNTNTNTQPETNAQPKSGLLSGGGMEDMREGIAQRELDKIKAERLPAGDAYKRYSNFLLRYRSTKAGKEAETLLKSVESAAARPPEGASGTQPGLKAQRYEVRKDKYLIAKEPIDWNKSLDTVTIGNVDFGDKGKLGSTFKAEEYLVLQITGFLEVPRDGAYTLMITSDDGSLLYLGDQVFINNDGDHGMNEKAEMLPLKAGKHKIKIIYYNGKGDAGLVFAWSGPDIPKQAVPASALSHIK